MFEPFICLTTDHDWRLVVVAAAICLFASLVAISLFHRAQQSTGREKSVWLFLDAIAAGYGIWATHFVAILAYVNTFGAGYNLSLTILSLIFAIWITGAGLIIAAHDFSPARAAIGGAVLGFGVAVMHFTGMGALELPGTITWSLSLVAVAVLAGIFLGSLALVFAVKKGTIWNTVLAAVLLTLAVTVTHFTAMGAMTFVRDPAYVTTPASLSADSLSALVAGAAAVILGMCLVAALSDRQSKSKLQQQKLLLDTAIENMPQGLCMFEANGHIALFNERYTKMFGLSAESLRGASLLDILREAKKEGGFTWSSDELNAQVISDMSEGRTASRLLENPMGRTIHALEHPMKEGGWIATFEDITEWREAQELISHMSRHDDLTNLPNRKSFREQLERALYDVARNGQVAVLCIGLDHFKDVNDSFGHAIGDDLLKEVARRLFKCVRKGDTVARLAGDEFTVVQVNVDSRPSEASSLAGRLIEELGSPYDMQGHRIVIGASIGIAVAPTDGCDADQLLTNASMALSLAKESGRGAFRFFETGMDARAQARRLLLVDLRAAVMRDEFVVYYQPIYDLESDRITCFEALLRWNHPFRGLIAPLDFIPLAEETGLIVPIGDWVLRKACHDASSWPKDISVAVNLSPMQFKNRNPVHSVTAALHESGLQPSRLELEITESVLLQESETTLAALHKLREGGVRISMDDFGTGYSSLSYLRSFPFDKIKIDRSFVQELASRGDSMAIVRAVTGLGKSLGITTLAEGVETEEQLDLLRTEGCKEVQGFLFSKPQPISELDHMMSNSRLRGVA